MTRRKIIILFSLAVVLLFLAEFKREKLTDYSSDSTLKGELFFFTWNEKGLNLSHAQNSSEHGYKVNNIPIEYRPLFSVKIPINLASADLLASVNGVGPATADKIIELRQQKGKIVRPEELLVIKGIGHKKLNSLKNQYSFE